MRRRGCPQRVEDVRPGDGHFDVHLLDLGLDLAFVEVHQHGFGLEIAFGADFQRVDDGQRIRITIPLSFSINGRIQAQDLVLSNLDIAVIVVDDHPLTAFSVPVQSQPPQTLQMGPAQRDRGEPAAVQGGAKGVAQRLIRTLDLAVEIRFFGVKREKGRGFLDQIQFVVEALFGLFHHGNPDKHPQTVRLGANPVAFAGFAFLFIGIRIAGVQFFLLLILGVIHVELDRGQESFGQRILEPPPDPDQT